MSGLPKLEAMFHQPVRTRLAVLLASAPQTFSQLKAALEVTDGNLDAHLRKLSAAGYLHSQMIADGRPRTLYELSPSGRRAFEDYASAMRVLLDRASFDGAGVGRVGKH